MKYESVLVVAKRLKNILKMGFGGKSQGRYKISYARMQEIAGTVILNDSYIEFLTESCFQNGITIINLGCEFAIIETEVLKGYRNLPQGVIDKVLKDN